MYGRPSRAKPLAPPPPLPEQLVDEFHERPWFGESHGELMAVPPSEPTPPVTGSGLVIEPPPWKDADAALSPPPEPSEPRPDALEALKRANGDEGWNPPSPLPQQGPPPPPLPPSIGSILIDNPPDWREELEREAAGANQDELEPEHERYPAKPKPKAKTPNIDAVRAWRGRS